MANNIITLTIEELQSILDEQKVKTAQHIARYMSMGYWFRAGTNGNKEEIESAKAQINKECTKSDYPDDFITLKKYLK